MNTIDLQVKAEVVLLSEKGRRVVVTGLGMVSCLGTDTDIFFDKLCSGVDATSPITSFQTNGLKKKFAVQIKDDIPIMDKWKHYYRTMQFCLVAAHNALQDAHIPVDTNKNEWRLAWELCSDKYRTFKMNCVKVGLEIIGSCTTIT